MISFFFDPCSRPLRTHFKKADATLIRGGAVRTAGSTPGPRADTGHVFLWHQQLLFFVMKNNHFAANFLGLHLFCLCFFCSIPVSATIPNCSFHASSSICSSYKESFLCSAIVSRLRGCYISIIVHLFHS